MKGKGVLPYVIFVGVAATFFAYGCSPAGDFGEPLSAAKETPITDVLDNPGEFQGKTVKVTGQIMTVDDDGLGFQLDNGSGTVIYVKVAGDFKVAKAARYHLTTAEGTVDVDGDTGKARINAAGVNIK